jgi:hypothetical protein
MNSAILMDKGQSGGAGRTLDRQVVFYITADIGWLFKSCLGESDPIYNSSYIELALNAC